MDIQDRPKLRAKLKIKTRARKMRSFQVPVHNFDHNKAKEHYQALVKFSGLFERKFTTREIEVLFFLKQKLKNREIAEALFLTEKTIKFHLTKVFKMTGTKTRADLISWVFIVESSALSKEPEQKIDPEISTESKDSSGDCFLPRQKKYDR